MGNKNVSNIITKGTPRQRVVLLFSHYALQQFDVEGFLTGTEVNSIIESFKAPQEIKLYNKFVDVDRTVRNSIHYLNQLRLGYREQIANITGYATLWLDMERMEDLLNSILYDTNDKKLKTEFIKKITETEVLLASFKKSKEEGYISLEVNSTTKRRYSNAPGLGLLSLIKIHKKNAEDFLINAKTFLKALYDYIEETGFSIKDYKNYIKGIEEDLKENKAILSKFSREAFIKEFPDSDTSNAHFIFPDYETIAIDQDKYRGYRKDYLNEK
jgi:hypothetical protein